MESEDAYSLLNIPRTSDPDQILQAYRQKALEYHPHRFQPHESFIKIHFKKLADAYETLIDPHKRREYDLRLESKEMKKKLKNLNTTNLDQLQQPIRPLVNERSRRKSCSNNRSINPAIINSYLQSRSNHQQKSSNPIRVDPPFSSDLQPTDQRRTRRNSISTPSFSHHLLDEKFKFKKPICPVKDLPLPSRPASRALSGLSSAFHSSTSSKLNGSSIQLPTRTGSCDPTLERIKQTPRLEESLLSLKLNQQSRLDPTHDHLRHRQGSSSAASHHKPRLDRQSIINELNSRARANSTTALLNLPSSYSSSSSSSSFLSSVSPTSTTSSSSSHSFHPWKFSSSPSASSHFHHLQTEEPECLAEPGLDYQPLLTNHQPQYGNPRLSSFSLNSNYSSSVNYQIHHHHHHHYHTPR